MNEKVWYIGRMILTGENKYSEKNLYQRHSALHKPCTGRSGTEDASPGDKQENERLGHGTTLSQYQHLLVLTIKKRIDWSRAQDVGFSLGWTLIKSGLINIPNKEARSLYWTGSSVHLLKCVLERYFRTRDALLRINGTSAGEENTDWRPNSLFWQVYCLLGSATTPLQYCGNKAMLVVISYRRFGRTYRSRN